MYAAKEIDVRRNIIPDDRKRVFVKYIHPLAEQDILIRSGVEIAKQFMDSRQESCSLEGIPDDSPIFTTLKGK